MGKESIFAVLTLIQRQTEACQKRAIFFGLLNRIYIGFVPPCGVVNAPTTCL